MRQLLPQHQGRRWIERICVTLLIIYIESPHTLWARNRIWHTIYEINTQQKKRLACERNSHVYGILLFPIQIGIIIMAADRSEKFQRLDGCIPSSLSLRKNLQWKDRPWWDSWCMVHHFDCTWAPFTQKCDSIIRLIDTAGSNCHKVYWSPSISLEQSWRKKTPIPLMTSQNWLISIN